jgi:hypothetical protein
MTALYANPRLRGRVIFSIRDPAADGAGGSGDDLQARSLRRAGDDDLKVGQVLAERPENPGAAVQHEAQRNKLKAGLDVGDAVSPHVVENDPIPVSDEQHGAGVNHVVEAATVAAGVGRANEIRNTSAE